MHKRKSRSSTEYSANDHDGRILHNFKQSLLNTVNIRAPQEKVKHFSKTIFYRSQNILKHPHLQ